MKWNLIQELGDILESKNITNFSLETCKYVARSIHKKKQKDGFTDGELVTLEKTLEKMNTLPQTKLEDIFERLYKIPGIDAGEVQYFQKMKEDKSFLLTGDKKALNAISKIKTEFLNLSFMEGRVVHWFDILKYILEKMTLDKIQASVKNVKTDDILFRTLFSAENLKSKEKILLHLESYIQDLRTSLGKYLIDFKNIAIKAGAT